MRLAGTGRSYFLAAEGLYYARPAAPGRYITQTLDCADTGTFALPCPAEYLAHRELQGRVVAKVRERWPECPSDDELRSQQKCLLGVARFVDGNVSAAAASATDFFLANYDCAKAVAWRADAATSCAPSCAPHSPPPSPPRSLLPSPD